MKKNLKYKIIIVVMMIIFTAIGSVFAYYKEVEKTRELEQKYISDQTSDVNDIKNTEVEQDDKEILEITKIERQKENSELKYEYEKPQVAKKKDIVICIDPGHGITSRNENEPLSPWNNEPKPGFASGTQGVATKMSERELNLIASAKLKEALETHGFKVIMTRETDYCDLGNVERAEIANREQADLFVRIHANGSENQSIKGILMLVPSITNLKIPDVIKDSRIAGEKILNQMLKSTGARSLGVVERSDMIGFNWSKVPVILIEMGFMSNPEEDRLMSTPEYQDKLVQGMLNGILEYFGED